MLSIEIVFHFLWINIFEAAVLPLLLHGSLGVPVGEASTPERKGHCADILELNGVSGCDLASPQLCHGCALFGDGVDIC